MKNQEVEDEETKRKRLRYERELARSRYYVKKTDLSIPICEWIVKNVLFENKFGGYILDKKINEMLGPYLINETLVRLEMNSMPSIGWHDSGFEMNPGEEPPTPINDLWSTEKINVEKYYPQFIIKKSSILSNTSPLSGSNGKSIRSKQRSVAPIPTEEKEKVK